MLFTVLLVQSIYILVIPLSNFFMRTVFSWFFPVLINRSFIKLEILISTVLDKSFDSILSISVFLGACRDIPASGLLSAEMCSSYNWKQIQCQYQSLANSNPPSAWLKQFSGAHLVWLLYQRFFSFTFVPELIMSQKWKYIVVTFLIINWTLFSSHGVKVLSPQPLAS